MFHFFQIMAIFVDLGIISHVLKFGPRLALDFLISKTDNKRHLKLTLNGTPLRISGNFFSSITKEMITQPLNIVVLIPAWNEGDVIASSINSLYQQTRKPDRIIVVPNNTTDKTYLNAFLAGAEVIPMPGKNLKKKAGALNFILDKLSDDLDAEVNSAVLVMDADTNIEKDFIEKAELKMQSDSTVGGVSSLFVGRETNSILGELQRLEFERFGKLSRRRAEVFVLSGTASLIRWETLKRIKEARLEGKILPFGEGYYDVDSMTEDNELTLAILTIGYTVPHCSVESITDAMEDYKSLYHQRKRWYLGALQNIKNYGLKMPLWMRSIYWFQQLGLYIALAITLVVLSTFLIYIFSSVGMWNWNGLISLALFGVYVLSQVVTIWSLGWKARIIALLYFPEIIYSVFLIIFYAAALWSIVRKKEVTWKHT